MAELVKAPNQLLRQKSKPVKEIDSIRDLAAEIVNFLVPESMKYPLASAVVCDRCLKEKRDIKYAMAGVQGEDGAEYYRVPITELEEPKVYWPDLHPDRQPIIGG